MSPPDDGGDLRPPTSLLWLHEIDPADVSRVGGKASGLARLLRAGLPVPPGFCIPAGADPAGRGLGEGQAAASGDAPPHPAAPESEVREAYRRLGSGRVAVRSSATAEDSADFSFAGQQATFLNVEGEEALLRAVAECRASLRSARSRAYRERQGLPEDALAMAVVVQRMVDSEASGVLFTRDPLEPGGEALRVEASWGLGEAVVSGRVTPDSFRVSREDGRVLERRAAQEGGGSDRAGAETEPEGLRDSACLSDAELAELAALARRVEEVCGAPQDVEWALAGGRLWVLQARPITAAASGERERARREEMARARELADPRGTVWSRYSLAELVPEPLPMTWSILRRFLSGRGGFGLMYRDLGYDPDPALDEEGILDLICGRAYVNLSRERRIYFKDFPYDYPFEALKADPRKAVYPTPQPNLSIAPRGFWPRLPRTALRMAAAERRLRSARETLHRELRERVGPRFLREAGEAASEDLSRLTPRELLERLEHWRVRTLDRLARDSLKPSLLAGLALEALTRRLARELGPGKAGTAARALVASAAPDPEADLGLSLREAARGRLSIAELLERVGHRGSLEMELARPRWREEPEALEALVASLAGRGPEEAGEGARQAPPSAGSPAPDEALLSPAAARDLGWARLYLGLRETAKHWLMAGYAEIRRSLVALDRWFGLEGGVFFLYYEELPRLVSGEDLRGLAEERRRRRELLLSLECPRVLFSDDLEALGRPEAAEGREVLTGAAVSPGVAEGPALVAARPEEVPAEAGGFILVCPSTDPGWCSAFLRARGLAMETGGVLSHGAIVAREFRLPAVANLPGLLGGIRTGDRVRVDGDLGIVTVLSRSG